MSKSALRDQTLLSFIVFPMLWSLKVTKVAAVQHELLHEFTRAYSACRIYGQKLSMPMTQKTSTGLNLLYFQFAHGISFVLPYYSHALSIGLWWFTKGNLRFVSPATNGPNWESNTWRSWTTSRPDSVDIDGLGYHRWWVMLSNCSEWLILVDTG